MKNKIIAVSALALVAALLVPIQPVQADVSISYSSGHHHPQHRNYRQHSYRHNPWPARHHYRDHRRLYPYYSHPVVREQVIYVTPSPVRTYSSVDKEQDVAVFRERVAELRSMINDHKDKGGLSSDSHERLLRDLDNLERDEHARTYDRGGRLHADDFADFYYRLNDTSLEFTRLVR